MRLSALNFKSSKNPEDFSNNLILQKLIQGGIIKYEKNSGVILTPYGQKIFESFIEKYELNTKVTDSVSLQYKSQKPFKSILQAIEKLFEMVKFEYKSYKSLPTELVFNTVSSDGEFNYDTIKLCVMSTDDEYRKVMELESNCLILNHKHRYFSENDSRVRIFSALFKEHELLLCHHCNYGSPVNETPVIHDHHGANLSNETVIDFKGNLIFTPDVKKIETLSEFLKVLPHQIVKSIALMKSECEPLLVFIRGDRNLSLDKVKKHLNCNVRMATDDEIISEFSSFPGFIGPFVAKNSNVICLYDLSVLTDTAYVVGGNQVDYHRKDVVFKSISKTDYCDFSSYEPGDICPICGEPLELGFGIEIAQIYKIGENLSNTVRANYLDEKGISQKHSVLGVVYDRINLFLDDFGNRFFLNENLNNYLPFQYRLMTLNHKKEEQRFFADTVYNLILDKQLNILYDDRVESAGIKFYDAEIYNDIPIIVIGNDAKDALLNIQYSGTKMEKIKIDDLFLWVESR